MKSVEAWLSEYGESHQNATNKLIHWICVPLIMLSLVGLLASIPTPDAWQELPFPVHFGTIFVSLVIIYYSLLSLKLALGMLLISIGLIAANYGLATGLALPLWGTSLIIFALAWVGQFIGHKIEGKKPSFLQDIQFLLIGPLWLLSFVYKRMGIRI